MTNAAGIALRERGWRLFLPALALWLLVPGFPVLHARGIPLLRVLFPIQETPVFLVVAVAACALGGFARGGRWWLALVWVLLGWALVRFGIGGNSAAYQLLAAGWMVLVASTFALTCLIAPRQTFFPRALGSVALVMAFGAMLLGMMPASATDLRNVVSTELAVRSSDIRALQDSAAMRGAIERRMVQSPALRPVVDAYHERLAEALRLAPRAFPSLLALESLAALALGWGLYHRLDRTRLGAPLGRVTTFTFSDQLVWGVIVGVTLLVLPAFVAWRVVGLNLVLFFGALYALRGAGVVLSYTNVPLALLVLVVLILIGWRVLGGVTIALGLGDTWLDWRRHVRPAT